MFDSRLHRRCRAFTIAELLVVCGVIALLLAISIPPLQMAKRQAERAKCAANLQQIGRALETGFTEYGFYPLWDDGGASVRFTWLDILAENQLLGTTTAGARARDDYGWAIGYCPTDARPDPLNTARNRDLEYPPNPEQRGMDYSYGIAVPLSAGGWAWRPNGDDDRPRRFTNYQQNTSGRVLAGDAFHSGIYNLSGDAWESRVWNQPTQFDNTVAWSRHVSSDAARGGANLLFQDGHVSFTEFDPARSPALSTTQAFVWYPGEPLNVDLDHSYDGNWYPYEPPPGFATGSTSRVYPDELTPAYFSQNNAWTSVRHKAPR